MAFGSVHLTRHCSRRRMGFIARRRTVDINGDFLSAQCDPLKHQPGPISQDLQGLLFSKDQRGNDRRSLIGSASRRCHTQQRRLPPPNAIITRCTSTARSPLSPSHLFGIGPRSLYLSLIRCDSTSPLFPLSPSPSLRGVPPKQRAAF